MWLGIDFGTCYSSAAFLKDKIPTPVKFGVQMDRNITSLPSSVYLDEQGKMLVGLAAESRRGRARHDPTRYRREFKRELGARSPLPLGDREMLPEQLAAEVLRALKAEAEKNQMLANGSPASAVLTIPASYKKQKKELMCRAATGAGFGRVELLPEPVAAAIYYAWRSGAEREGETTLVYDLGGGTFDAALIRKRGNEYESLAASVGHERLGGIDFDRLIGDHLLERCGDAVRQLLKGKGAADDETQLKRLRHRLTFADQCREMKEQLSWDTEAAVVFPQEPLNEYTLTRGELNELIAPLIAETCDICRKLVDDAGVKWKEVDRVLLVGGSSRIPYVEETVGRELKRPVVRADDPDLAVCFGAAVYTKKFEDVLDLPPEVPGTRRTAENSGPQPHPMASAYQSVVEIAWADRKLDRREVEKLESVRKGFGLSEGDAEAVELAVIGRSKEETLRRQEQARKRAEEKKRREAEEKRIAEEKAAERKAAEAARKRAEDAAHATSAQSVAGEQEILQVLREGNLGSSFYVHPNIPDRKLRNSRAACSIPDGEKILGLLDITFFGSAKEGVFFTDKGLYFRGTGGTPAGSIRYWQFRDCTFEEGWFYTVRAGNGVKFDINGANTTKAAVVAVLKNLQKLFR